MTSCVAGLITGITSFEDADLPLTVDVIFKL